jgi:hypothetical protein
MAVFNYRQFIRQVPARSWKFYCQARRLTLPEGFDWDIPEEKLAAALIAFFEDLNQDSIDELQSDLRLAHDFANRRGIDALRSAAPKDSPLHDDLPQLSSDAERALWAIVNWPQLVAPAAAILAFNLRAGGRGWKRLKIASCPTLHRGDDEIKALEAALAAAFTPRKGTPRACQIEAFDRHLDGGIQLGILIEDNPQRQLEFGEDDRVHWRDMRPPQEMHLVIYPATGIIDIIVPGGRKNQAVVLMLFGHHILRSAIQPQAITEPMLYLNRLRDGFELFDDTQVDLAAYQVQHIRLTQARVRSALTPLCDYTIKPDAGRDSPDALACIQAHKLDHPLLGSGFNIIEAIVSLYFLPSATNRLGRTLHIELKQNGISNLRDMSEDDAKLAEALLIAWGVMQSNAANVVPAYQQAETSE